MPLCVDCRRLAAMHRRELCNLCEAAVRTGRKVPAKPTQYRPEDYVGKRAALKRMIEAAKGNKKP